MRESIQKYRKTYVQVAVIVRPDGSIRPTCIYWEDGSRWKIDRVKAALPRASTKVGGRGIRYTIEIGGKERELFDEDGRWFVEVPAGTGDRP